MGEFLINENDSDQRLDKFVLKALPDLPKSLMYKMIRKKDIRLNGKKCDISSRLSCGDIVYIYASERFTADNHQNEKIDFSDASDELSIIYEDDNIIIVDKPCGVTVHCDNEHSSDTLINRIKKYLYNSGAYSPNLENSFAPALCNRLDKNTVGLVVASKNASSLRIINEAIREGNITKIYHCITVGAPPKNSDIITAFHSKSDKQNIVTITDTPADGFKPIKTGYKVLRKNASLALLEITLFTGRTHQIRAHLSHIGIPVLGDSKYGKSAYNKKYNMKYQALCAYSLSFALPVTSPLAYLNDMTFKAHIPYFEKLL